jgi:hypothetical protein
MPNLVITSVLLWSVQVPYRTASVVYWPELLATDPEVPG